MANTTKIVINLTPILLAATAVLIVLKLTSVITWSWWAVTAPFWDPIVFSIAVWLLVVGVIGTLFVIAALLAK